KSLARNDVTMSEPLSATTRRRKNMAWRWAWAGLAAALSLNARAAHLMEWRLDEPPPLANVVGPLDIPDHRSTPDPADAPTLPVPDEPFIEHVRGEATESDWPETAPTAGGVDGLTATTPLI